MYFPKAAGCLGPPRDAERGCSETPGCLGPPRLLLLRYMIPQHPFLRCGYFRDFDGDSSEVAVSDAYSPALSSRVPKHPTKSRTFAASLKLASDRRNRFFSKNLSVPLRNATTPKLGATCTQSLHSKKRRRVRTRTNMHLYGTEAAVAL